MGKEKKRKLPDKPEKPGRPKKEKLAKNYKAKKGSDQAKINSSHKGQKINKWDPAMMEWALEYRKKEQATLPEKDWKPYSWYTEQTGISRATLWARFKGVVKGTSHQSGGKNKSKLLPSVAEDALAERAGEKQPKHVRKRPERDRNST